MVEQWPFKPFVTGSNPVRPNIFIFFITLSLFFINTYQAIASDEQVTTLSNNNIMLIGKQLSSEQNTSAFLIVHGTRGHKGMEIIETLSTRLYEEGYDVLSINLSYGFNNRKDDFLTCDIKHKHSEYESVDEIVTWYNYLNKRGYEQINFIGHSRGGLNVMQALSIISNKEIDSYLLAPVIDTYQGSKNYYEDELGIPYDIIIKSEENYNLADRYKKINFLFCENVDVYSQTFKSYLDFSENESIYPYTYDILELISNSESNVTIFSGTDDEILLDSYKVYEELDKVNVRTIILEGAGHFFRDLYLEDVIDKIIE